MKAAIVQMWQFHFLSRNTITDNVDPHLPSVLPVDEYIICGAVVLDLVHADPWYVVLRGPSDGSGAGCQVRHADPLLVRPDLAPAHVGLDGGGNVRRPWVRVQFGVIVW